MESTGPAENAADAMSAGLAADGSGPAGVRGSAGATPDPGTIGAAVEMNGGGGSSTADDGTASAGGDVEEEPAWVPVCECPPSRACSGGPFCPGRERFRRFIRGFELDSDVDDLARERVEQAGPESLVRMLLPRMFPPGLPEALDSLRAADRLTSWVAARQAELVAAVHSEVVGYEYARTGSDTGLGFTLAAEEIAALLNLSGQGAHRLLGRSLSLVDDLPGTLEALRGGRVAVRQAQIIVDESGALPAEALPEFESEALEAAPELTGPKLQAKCRRLREKLHPESITARRLKAAADRHVEVSPDQDGMAWLSAFLPAEQACGIQHRLTGMARALQCPQESRTLTQLKADVFAGLLTHYCEPAPAVDGADTAAAGGSGAAGPAETWASTELPGVRGRLACVAEAAAAAGVGSGNIAARDLSGVMGVQPVVFVTVPVMTLLGGDGPGELEGYGPIDPETARKLAAHAPGFVRILTHPETGVVLSVGQDRYKVPKGLRTAVLIRDKTCRHPGCNRSGAFCDIDHTIPWYRGGATAHDNLSALCRMHHMLKSEGYWHYGQPEAGTITATSLAGKTYTTIPEPPPF